MAFPLILSGRPGAYSRADVSLASGVHWRALILQYMFYLRHCAGVPTTGAGAKRGF